MKKIVPDPPTLKLVDTLHPAIHSDLIPPDALAIASDLLLGISEVIDTHCRGNAGEKGMKMLTNATSHTR